MESDEKIVTSSDEKIVTSSFQIDAPCNISYSKYILNRAVRYGNRPALIDNLTGTTYNYDQLTTLIDQFADSLRRMDFRKSDRVCLFTHNCIEFVIAYFGALSIGGVIVALNPLLTTYELKYYMKHAEPAYILADRECLKTVVEVSHNSSKLKEIIVIDNGESGYASFQSMLVDVELTSTRSHSPPSDEFHSKTEVASICYSSGTTGLPKGCIHSHYNIIASSMQMAHPGVNFLKDGSDVLIATVPFYHVYGQLNYFSLGLYMGATLVILPRFQIDTYLRTIPKYRVTVLLLAAPAVAQIASSSLTDKLDLSSVRHLVSGAAPLNQQLLTELHRKLPKCTLLDEYGMTEMLAGLCSFSPHNYDDSLRCTGKLLPSMQAKVIDVITGESLGPNQDGEILFKSPCHMIGYWNHVTVTEDIPQSLPDDGWLHSGDAGHYDKDGNFYIVERIKDILKYNGFQVSPSELEAVILKYPGVEDVAVVGKFDKVAGDLPTAFVVVKEIEHGSTLQKSITTQDIIDYVAGKLSPQKKLRGGVYFVKEIPKSPSGKILRRILRDVLNSERVDSNPSKQRSVSKL